MREPKIARTVAEAQVGEWLWVRANIWRPCPTELWPVRKVGRRYIYVGKPDYEHGWSRFEREQLRDNNSAAWGYAEREAAEWGTIARTMADRLKSCRDLDVLKTVAFALGVEGPPDFSVAPTRAPGGSDA